MSDLTVTYNNRTLTIRRFVRNRMPTATCSSCGKPIAVGEQFGQQSQGIKPLKFCMSCCGVEDEADDADGG